MIMSSCKFDRDMDRYLIEFYQVTINNTVRSYKYTHFCKFYKLKHLILVEYFGK